MLCRLCICVFVCVVVAVVVVVAAGSCEHGFGPSSSLKCS